MDYNVAEMLALVRKLVHHRAEAGPNNEFVVTSYPDRDKPFSWVCAYVYHDKERNSLLLIDKTGDSDCCVEVWEGGRSA